MDKPTVVEIEREVKASPDELFDLWTTPSQLMPLLGLKKCEVDLKEGGAWSWDWADDPCEGEYLAVEHPMLLVLSWTGKGRNGVSTGLTTMTLEFDEEEPGLTTMRLEHRLNSPELYPDYSDAWNGACDAIVRHFANR